MSILGCDMCPRKCGVERFGNIGSGVCAMGNVMRVALACAHLWEEPPISGVNGSGTIFFAGCSLGCVYCQNKEISSPGTNYGKAVSPRELCDIMRSLEDKGVHNISFVTGTHFSECIIEALELYRPNLPLVWNSSAYEQPKALSALGKHIDIWLPDYKYALEQPAAKYSHAADYPVVALEAIKQMRSFAPKDVFENGLMKKGMIVRHLLLPGNLRNSVAALRALAREVPNTLISIMSQYTPIGDIASVFPELGRTVSEKEYEKLLDEAQLLGIDGFIQDGAAASESFIPRWDMLQEA